MFRNGGQAADVRGGGGLGGGAPAGAGTVPSQTGDTVRVEILYGCAPSACGTAGFVSVGNPAGGLSGPSG